jgi:mRNA interferase HigB
MKLFRKNLLEKLKDKNKGNVKLTRAIDELITIIELKNWETKEEIKADVHRTLILLELNVNKEATIIWAGSRDSYERTFKNSKDTIKKYLRENNWI